MIKIDIRADFGPILKQLEGLKRDLQDKVIARTLNTIGGSTRLQARKEISREFNLPSAEVGNMIRVQRATVKGRNLEVAVVAESKRGRSLNLVRFVERRVTLAEAKRRRKGGTLDRLRVKVKKTGPVKMLGRPKWAASDPFIITANGGTFVAARRKTPGPRGGLIGGVQTIDVPSMFNTKRLNALLLQQIRAKFPGEFDRQFAAVMRGY